MKFDEKQWLDCTFEKYREFLATLDEDDRIEFEERVAIMQFDGGMSELDAIRKAFYYCFIEGQQHGN